MHYCYQHLPCPRENPSCTLPYNAFQSHKNLYTTLPKPVRHQLAVTLKYSCLLGEFIKQDLDLASRAGILDARFRGKCWKVSMVFIFELCNVEENPLNWTAIDYAEVHSDQARCGDSGSVKNFC